MELKYDHAGLRKFVAFCAQLTDRAAEECLSGGSEFTIATDGWTASSDLAERYESKLKECFANCQRIVLEDGGYTYLEGYAWMEGLIPTLHAAVLDPDGHLVDPTWALVTPGRSAVNRRTANQRSAIYLMRRFEFQHVLSVVLDQEAYGPLLLNNGRKRK